MHEPQVLDVVVKTLLSVLEKLSADSLLDSILELASNTDASVVRSTMLTNCTVLDS